MRWTHRQVSLAVACSALAAFLWPVAVFWLGWPALSPPARRANAIAFLFLWALGPAVWFALEWRTWKSEPGLAETQRSGRDFSPE